MRTKIRLALDCGIQLLLIGMLLIQIVSNPTESIHHVGMFAFLITIWQIVHALYVVQKYQDWYRGLYLKAIKKVILSAIIILSVAAIVAIGTLGFFLPYVLQLLQVLGLGLGGIVALLAFQYFGRSLLNLRAYYYRPRSFWDL